MTGDRHAVAFVCRVALLAAVLCVLAAAAALALRFWPLALCGAVWAAWRHRRRWQGTGTAHGTARWAGLNELQAGMLGEEGLILARAGPTPPPNRSQALRALLTAPWRESDLACRLFLAAFGSPAAAADRLIR